MNAAELPELLACPVCQDGELLGLDEQPVDGLLSCSRCLDSWPEEVAARRRAVEEHSWERRVDEMVDIVLQAQSRRKGQREPVAALRGALAA